MSTVEYPLGEPTKESLLFVTFEYAGNYVRYTDWDNDLVHPTTGETHTSVPNMNVKIPKQSGMFKEAPASAALPLNTFTGTLSSGEPWPEVTVTIEELTQDLDETVGRMLYLFKGTLRRTIKNYNGNPDSIQLEVENIKSALTVPMGLIATHHCNWIFGDTTKGCDPGGGVIGLAALKETGTLTVIDGNQVTITGLTNPRAGYWHRGYVELDGLRIVIREWLTGTPTIFELVKMPPASWLAASVTVAPGCDKTVETCRLWSNEAHFVGCGYAMPPYHPVLETP